MITNKARIPITRINTSVPNYTGCEPMYHEWTNFTQPGEVFLWITHSPITPNVMQYRYLVSNYGRIYDACLHKFLNLVDNGRGYLKVKITCFSDPYTLYNLDVYIHRLVAFFHLYFLGCENLEVNHINGDKSNNSVLNLEWVSPEYNKIHAIETGLCAKGENKPNAIITNEQAEEICKLIVGGYSNKEISKIMNIPNTDLIYSIRSGNTFSFISRKYNIQQYLRKQDGYLSDTQVHEICKLLLEGRLSMRAIAEKVGCREHQVKDIKYNNRYSNISNMYKLEEIPERKVHNRANDEIIKKACKMLESRKYSCVEISKKLGLPHSTVVAIKNGRYYTDISKNYNLPGLERSSYSSKETARKICVELEKNDGRTAEQIAKDLNVKVHTVRDIKSGKSFSDISKEYNITKNKRVILKENDIRSICKMLEDNIPVSVIMKKFNLSDHAIYNIKNRKTYTDISKDYNF